MQVHGGEMKDEILEQASVCANAFMCSPDFCEYFDECTGAKELLKYCVGLVEGLIEKKQTAEIRVSNLQREVRELKNYRRR